MVWFFTLIGYCVKNPAARSLLQGPALYTTVKTTPETNTEDNQDEDQEDDKSPVAKSSASLFSCESGHIELPFLFLSSYDVILYSDYVKIIIEGFFYVTKTTQSHILIEIL